MNSRALWLALPLLIACDPLAVGQVVRTHPCQGNRTDTLWADNAEDWWVGCGSTTNGTGLFATSDAGRSWQSIEGFESFRVSHVHRAPDGVLYVAGTEVGGSGRVRTVDNDPVLDSTGQLWNSYHVGSFVQLDDGTEIAESLTGTGVATRAGPDAEWGDGEGWSTDDSSYQMLDMVQFDGRLVGVGSTITQPPTVFVQVQGEVLSLQPVGVDPDLRGELWAVDADASGVVAGGVDQDASVGRIYVFTAGGDPTDSAAWRRIDVGAAVDGDSWIRGVCRQGDFMAAVGENPRTGDGILLFSSDGGDVWDVELPYQAPALSACDIVGDNQIVMTGARGWLSLR